MKQRGLLTLAATLGGAAIIAACASDEVTSQRNGTLVVRLTDAPFPYDSVGSVDVFVVRVDAKREDSDSAAAATAIAADSSARGGWVTVASPNKTIDILKLRNDTTTIGTTSVSQGDYRSFRLIVDPSKSSVTLKNGTKLSGNTSPGIVFPSAAQTGIKIRLDRTIPVGDSTTTMVVDFDLENSFIMRGNSIAREGLLFKPTIKASLTKSTTTTTTTTP
jgi:hypothetical protein